MNRVFPDHLNALATAPPDPAPSSAELEQLVARFEEARFAGEQVLLTDYLPPPGHPARVAAASELVRVDLEMSRSFGQPHNLEHYRALVPELFRNPAQLALAAYEEWRLAFEAGVAIPPQQYLDRYGLHAEDWPQTVTTGKLDHPPAKYPAVGQSFDGMMLERVLGVGAFSRVYVARQPQFSNRAVALKITTQASLEPERLGRLQHTNIVPIYSVHRDQGWLGICMPLLGEATLARKIDQQRSRSLAPIETDSSTPASTLAIAHDPTIKRPPTAVSSAPAATRESSIAGKTPWREAARIAAELAAGLAHAHQRGLVHSDIKPANILLGDDGVPRLLDFNLANDSSAADRQSLLVGGTLPYLAPEHLAALKNGSAATAACDQYALAVVLYELLTGQLPYPRRRGDFDSMRARLEADRQTPAPLIQHLAPEVPSGLCAIVAKALAPQPNDRYAGLADLESELRRELADEPLLVTREPSLAARSVKWLRRKRTQLLRQTAIACGLLTALAFGSWLWQREQTALLTVDQAYGLFVDHHQAARTSLCAPEGDRDLQLAGFAAATAALEALRFDSRAAHTLLNRLNPQQQNAVATAVSELQELVEAPSTGDTPLRGELEDAVTTLTSAKIALGAANQSPLPAAIELLRAGEFQPAADLLRRSLEERAYDPALWMERGVALAALNQRAEARECFAAAIALQPKSSAAWRHRAYLALDEQRHADALADLDRALAITPQSAEVQLNRALALLGLKQFAAADQAVSEAINQGAQRPRAYALRRRCRLQNRDFAGAQRDQQAALAAKPLDDEDWAALALVRDRSEAQQALSDLDRGLSEYPRSVVLLRNRIHLLGDVLGRRADALAATEVFLQVAPNDLPAQLGRAVCLASLGREAEAMTAAKALHPVVQRPLDRLQLACVYALASAEQPQPNREALELLRTALAGDPTLASRAKRDRDLQTLHDSPEYTEVIAAAERLVSPGAEQD